MRPASDTARIAACLLIGYGVFVSVDFMVTSFPSGILYVLAYSPRTSMFWWALAELVRFQGGIFTTLVGIRLFRKRLRLRSSLIVIAIYGFFLGSAWGIARLWEGPWGIGDCTWIVGEYSIFFGCLIALLALRYSEKRIPLCHGCGYLLVGLREPRCPECGRVYTLDEFYEL